ncbi:ABC transporter substrate-binding protein [Streptomyces sp. MNP-20]|uniref:ABC transporter substrate-binding protein n=1 Tax=Streptomyces sp. MNP-20 TaxID=2721165 RepID=UPI0015572105|nr:ABC transporter substrate-binding protein [Streptomyces sp. MNP-20]
MRLSRRRNGFGPLDKAVAIVVPLVLIAVGVVVYLLLRPEDCPGGLSKHGGECVGVTESAFEGDEDLDGLIRAVADENARVERAWEDPEQGQAPMPYGRIALMMPFTSDEASAMTAAMIRRALAGAHAAQLKANSSGGPHYQLLLAPDGKDLDQWRPVVDDLTALVDDRRSPLVGVMGLPSSTPETRDAMKELSARRIATVGPVITSADMNAAYFFKTSPNNSMFVDALGHYLKRNPGDRKGFLVYDSRPDDVYSRNLHRLLQKKFGKAYGLRRRSASYLGSTGPAAGIPQRFQSAAQKICLTESDTVFFAGRDQDLPALVKRLSQESSCDRRSPVRILKVGIGLEPTLTTDELTGMLRETKTRIVAAASVTPAWWTPRGQAAKGAPAGLGGFLRVFHDLDERYGIGEKPLDDGYAIMYHDAFTLLSNAYDRSYSEANEKPGSSDRTPAPARTPTKDDVYNTLINAGIVERDGRLLCTNCLQGAAGTYAFEQSPETRQWPICKPIPVIEYPAQGRGGPGKTYRTFEDTFAYPCP